MHPRGIQITKLTEYPRWKGWKQSNSAFWTVTNVIRRLSAPNIFHRSSPATLSTWSISVSSMWQHTTVNNREKRQFVTSSNGWEYFELIQMDAMRSLSFDSIETEKNKHKTKSNTNCCGENGGDGIDANNCFLLNTNRSAHRIECSINRWFESGAIWLARWRRMNCSFIFCFEQFKNKFWFASCYVNWAHDLPIGPREFDENKKIKFYSPQFKSIQFVNVRANSKQQTRLWWQAKATTAEKQTNYKSHAFGALDMDFKWKFCEMIYSHGGRTQCDRSISRN